jgi:hypothetical protein
MTMADYLLDLIRRDLRLPSRREWLERLATREPVVVDASALVELLLQRERAPAVLQAVGDTPMVAPDVINPEVLWALRRREQAGTLRRTTARFADAAGPWTDLGAAITMPTCGRAPTTGDVESDCPWTSSSW